MAGEENQTVDPQNEGQQTQVAEETKVVIPDSQMLINTLYALLTVDVEAEKEEDRIVTTSMMLDGIQVTLEEIRDLLLDSNRMQAGILKSISYIVNIQAAVMKAAEEAAGQTIPQPDASVS